MSQHRQAASRGGAHRAGQRGTSRKQEAGHSTRNMILIIVGAVIVFSLIGFGAAVVYDRTSGQQSSLTAEDAQATAVGGDGARALMVRRYLNEHYADAIWYTSVLEYKGDGSAISLETNLPNEPFGKARAAKMCDAVSSYIYSEGRTEAKFTSVEILDISGKPLVNRPDRNTVCTEVSS